MGTSIEGVLAVYSNGFVPLNKMAAMPIYGKNKHFKCTIKNQESFMAEPRNIT